MTELDLITGRIVLEPGGVDPVRCERPMVGAAMMRRLTEGRRAAMLPDLVGTVFSLCAAAQRMTSRRAVAAALGLPDDAAAMRRERLALRLHTAREHLQRLALDLPQRLALGTPEVAWLRGSPVQRLPARHDEAAEGELRQAGIALGPWLERTLLGVAPATWLQAWRTSGDEWLSAWVSERARAGHALGGWLQALEPRARALALPCRPLTVAQAPGDMPGGFGELARHLADDEDFAERPTWQGATAETGPWTRGVGALVGGQVPSLWQRLGARVAELAWLADGGEPALGTVRLAPGEALAWSDMSRGLLVHWLRLADGPVQPDTARAERYRVLAPTEWNFHPDGALARALRSPAWSADDAVLAAAVLDPCVQFQVRQAEAGEDASGGRHA